MSGLEGAAVLCDECRPRPVRAVWRLEGVDPRGRRYRATTCDAHVDLAQHLADERGGAATLAPCTSPVWTQPPHRPVRDDDYGAAAGEL